MALGGLLLLFGYRKQTAIKNGLISFGIFKAIYILNGKQKNIPSIIGREF